MSRATVLAVHACSTHEFSKSAAESIELVAGVGVVGDAHAGAQVKHRSRVAADPTQPNLRQVHLMHGELFDFVADKGYTVEPGNLGENITTSGIDILGLPTGTTLALGPDALVTLTGLRNPCGQINGFSEGLLKELVYNDEDGNTVRLGGVMSVVIRGGIVRPDDEIQIGLPPQPHHPLVRV
jgi:MOSC domain-containing protein YiiM